MGRCIPRLGYLRPPFLLAVTLPAWAGQYIISTFAGGAPLPGPPVAAASVPIGAPSYVATDAAGNVYFCSAGLNSVFKVDPAGLLTRVAGSLSAGYSGDGGPAVAARLHVDAGGLGQGSITVGGQGDLFIADTANHRIRKVSADGTIITVAGNGSPGFAGDGGPAIAAQLQWPTGVAVDATGSLFIADRGNLRIRRVSPDGAIATVADAGTVGEPWAVTVDTGGNVFLTDTRERMIRKVSPGGAITTVGTTAFTWPSSIAADAAGNLLVADPACSCVRRISPAGMAATLAGNGSAGFSGDNGPAASARLWDPWGVAVDRGGNVFVADRDNYRVRKVSPAGTITTFAGNGSADAYFSGDGGPAVSAQLRLTVGLAPSAGIAADRDGNLFIADTGNHRIRRIGADGIITTIAGAGPPCSATGACLPLGDGGFAAAASLSYPTAVALDTAGNLYVADYGHVRVRKVTPGGTITTVAGNGTPGSSGDGGPAAEAQLADITGVAVDDADNLYIAGGGRIRKVSADGTIATVAGGGTCDDDGNCDPLGDGGPALGARLSPSALAFDHGGNLLVGDSQVTDFFCERRIRRISPQGVITTVAGPSACGPPGPASQFDYTPGIAVDPAGHVFAADLYRQKIYELSPEGALTTVAGNGSATYSGDGGPAAEAAMNYPLAVTADGVGNLYVADGANNVIRVLRPLQAGR